MTHEEKVFHNFHLFGNDNVECNLSELGYSTGKNERISSYKERLLIIISDANYREYQAISNSLQSDIPIYLSKDTTLSTILKEENTPFIFVMDERLYMDDLFIPIKELPNYSDLYFHIMKTKYFRNL